MTKKKSETAIKRPPVLFKETQALIKQLGEHFDGDFISYWVSDNSRIINDDVVVFYEMMKNHPRKKTLYLFLKSNGGNGQASLRIINLLRDYYDEIIALVPLACASAATMLVLGANKIIMGSPAYLSAVDTSITHELSPVDKDNDLVSVSQVELSRVLKLWEEKIQGADGNPYNKLYDHMDDAAKVESISNHLNASYPSHGYPITFREAQKIGLNVEKMTAQVNDLLLDLSMIYSEMAQLALTDFDEFNYHDNEILKVIETSGLQSFYRKDKDMHYRKEERRWVPMNDSSSWSKLRENTEGGYLESKFYIN